MAMPHLREHDSRLLQSHQAPVFIGSVTLVVHDLTGMTGFYRDVIGLQVLTTSQHETTLGCDSIPLLHLIRDAHAKPRSSDMPGLFHTAFLMPQRADLAVWLKHASTNRIPLEGLSDHIVSEAAYLSDPEGNGIEMYCDRPPVHWQVNGVIRMGTARMDVASMMAEAGEAMPPARYQAPSGMRIGHVHLMVGRLQDASMLSGVLGMTKTCSYPQADFYASGEYHHHIAANTWQTSPTKAWAEGFTGLKEVLLQAPVAADRETLSARILAAGARQGAGKLVLTGPSGIPLALG